MPETHNSGDPRTWHSRGGLEAGKTTRVDPDFRPPNYGPNSLLEASNIDLIRSKVRSLVDNNPLFDGALHSLIDNVVGSGISIAAGTGFTDLDDEIDDYWEWVSEGVDQGRKEALCESQTTFLRELFVGECGVHIIDAEAANGYPALPAIDLIECDRIATDLYGRTDNGKGNRVRQGVEFDERGRVVAYHVLTEHPNDDAMAAPIPQIGAKNTRRITADVFDLAFEKRRKNQLRGLPMAISSVATARLEDQLLLDTMLAARLAAILGLFIQNGPDGLMSNDGNGSEYPVVDANGNPIERLEGGVLAWLKGNAEIKAVQTTQPGPQFEQTHDALQRRMSRPLGVSFEQISGNYSKTSFSSARTSKGDSRKRIERMQSFVVRHHTREFRRRVIDFALATGDMVLTQEQLSQFRRRPQQLYAGIAVAPGDPYVNPQQEANANSIDLENQVVSPQEIIRRRGGNPREILRQIKRWKDMCEEMGVDPSSAEIVCMPPERDEPTPGTPPKPNQPEDDE